MYLIRYLQLTTISAENCLFSNVSSRNFSTSSVRFDLSTHPLYCKINWELKGTKRAVVDPMDSTSILYLDEEDYKRYCVTLMSAHKNITVLAGENSTKPIPSGEVKSEDPSGSTNSNYSPPRLKFLFFSGLSPEDVRRSKKWLVPSLLNLKDLPPRLVGESTVIATKETLLPVLCRWGEILHFWSMGQVLVPTETALIFEFSEFLTKILVSNGPLAVVKRLKALYILVVAYCFGDARRSCDGLDVFISLTRDGIPRDLPPKWRHRLRSQDREFTRFLLSLLYSYKGLSIPNNKYNLASITDPSIATVEDIRSFCEEIINSNVFLNENFKIPLDGNGKLTCLSPGMPNKNSSALSSSGGEVYAHSSIRPSMKAGPNASIALQGIIYDISAWLKIGFSPILDYASSTGSSYIIKLINLLYYPHPRTQNEPKNGLWLGKLALKYEAAGKVRVFAIVDQISQWLLKPLHKILFKHLSKLETDSTFDQYAGVLRISTLNGLYRASLDLSSATDRVPVELYEVILSKIASPAFASAWKNLLVNRSFRGPKGEPVEYRVGQPMGAYSSWAMLAVAHHYIVRYAAKEAGIYDYQTFSEYQVLGDDVVIAHQEVARSYISVCNRLGIGISGPKSFESQIGGFQFASELFVRTYCISAASLKEELACRSLTSRLDFSQSLLVRWGNLRYSGQLVPLLLRASHPSMWEDLRKDLLQGRIFNPYWRVLTCMILGPKRNSLGLPLTQASTVKLWLESYCPNLGFLYRASQASIGKPIEDLAERGSDLSSLIQLVEPIVRSYFNIVLSDIYKIGNDNTFGTFTWKMNILSQTNISELRKFELLILPVLEGSELREKYIELRERIKRVSNLWDWWQDITCYPEEVGRPIVAQDIWDVYLEILDLSVNPIVVPNVKSPESRASLESRTKYSDSPFDHLIYKVGAMIRPRLAGEVLNLPKVALDLSPEKAPWYAERPWWLYVDKIPISSINTKPLRFTNLD